LLQDREHVAREAEDRVHGLTPRAGHVRDGVKDLKDQRHAVDDPNFFPLEVDELLGFKGNVVMRQTFQVFSEGVFKNLIRLALNSPRRKPGVLPGHRRIVRIFPRAGVIETGQERLLTCSFSPFGHWSVPQQCRLSLGESPFFRGARGDTTGHVAF
jgi:hypothetical protein